MSRQETSKVRRPASLRGAGLLAFLILQLAVGGCRWSGEGVSDASDQDLKALGLSSNAQIHRVTLGGRGSEEHAVPVRIEAFPGDGVEFVTVDHRVHTLRFMEDSLTQEVRAFLESGG